MRCSVYIHPFPFLFIPCFTGSLPQFIYVPFLLYLPIMCKCVPDPWACLLNRLTWSFMVLCSSFYPIVPHTGKRAEAKVYAASLREARRGRGEKSAGRRSAMVEGFLRDMVTSCMCRRGRTTMDLIQTFRPYSTGSSWQTHHGYSWDILI